jgi:hypothetical protein
MARRTTSDQHREFYMRHLRGETYQEIADRADVSKGCVRYWCPRQRDGGSHLNIYRREPRGLLSQFHPRVRYCILRLRLEQLRWGPNRIRAKLSKKPSLKGMALPSDASIGRTCTTGPAFVVGPGRSLIENGLIHRPKRISAGR